VQLDPSGSGASPFCCWQIKSLTYLALLVCRPSGKLVPRDFGGADAHSQCGEVENREFAGIRRCVSDRCQADYFRQLEACFDVHDASRTGVSVPAGCKCVPWRRCDFRGLKSRCGVFTWPREGRWALWLSGRVCGRRRNDCSVLTSGRS
jgi:hypothetical protein